MERLNLKENEELLALFRPYRGLVIKIVLLVIIQVALQMVIVISIKPLLNSGIKSFDTNLIILYGAAILTVVALHGACAIIVSHMSASASADMAMNLRRKLFRKIMTADGYNPSSSKSGVMVRLMSDVDNVQRFAMDLFRSGLYAILLSFGITVAAMFIDPIIGLLFFIAICAVYVRIAFAVRKEFRSRREVISKFENVIRVFRDDMGGAKRRRYLGSLDRDYSMFREHSAAYSKVSDETRIRAFNSSSISRVLFIVILLAVTSIFFKLSGTTAVTISNIVMYVQIILLLDSSLSMYSFLIETIPTASASIEKVYYIMKNESESPGIIPKGTDSELVIRSESPIIPSIKRGQETSIIVMSDSGTWDFTHLIMKFYRLPEGAAYLEDEDISKIDRSYLTENIAYAGPYAPTVNETLLENIRTWRDIDEDRIREVCTALGISKPLDFKVERSGLNISVGESFKISMARALVSNARIYIFDRCFNSLDHGTKRDIVRYIRSVLAGRTVIFISSDTSISDGSDNIVVVSEGKVICNDARADVMESCSLYADLRKARGDGNVAGC